MFQVISSYRAVGNLRIKNYTMLKEMMHENEKGDTKQRHNLGSGYQSSVVVPQTTDLNQRECSV